MRAFRVCRWALANESNDTVKRPVTVLKAVRVGYLVLDLSRKLR